MAVLVVLEQNDRLGLDLARPGPSAHGLVARDRLVVMEDWRARRRLDPMSVIV